MNAAIIGMFVGALAVTVGVGYIALAILWALRIYKKFPKSSVLIAGAFMLLVGLFTAVSSDAVEVYVVSTVIATAFVVWRGLRNSEKSSPLA